MRVFELPKRGSTRDEYEDAHYYRHETNEKGEDVAFRLAVADGATETSFSEKWARLLVRSYCAGRLDPATIESTVQKLSVTWRRSVGERPLPWYAQEKLSAGAFAALAGLRLCEDRRWSTLAAGDCCVFQTRNDALLYSFPYLTAEEFDARPKLLSSAPIPNVSANDHIKVDSGDWRPGDTFFLMTDALAAWFLRYSKLPDTDAVNFLKELDNADDFARFVELQRSDKQANGQPLMRNDDVTLLVHTVY